MSSESSNTGIANKLAVIPENKMFRFDKNISKNGIIFKKSYGEGHQTIFDVVMYIAHTFQGNLFQHGKLVVADFAKVMGYDRKNLMKPAKEPLQLRGRKKLDKNEIPMLTVIDNAVYTLGKMNLDISSAVYTHVDPSSGVKDETFKFLQLIRGVTKSTGVNGEIYYSFEVAKEFEAALSKYFLAVYEPLKLKPLRKKNLTYLYYLLRNLEEDAKKKGTYLATPFFDIICSYAEIEITAPKDKKQKLIKKLNELISLGFINFTFFFRKRDATKDNYEYQIVIEFTDLKIEAEPGGVKQASTLVSKKIMKKACLDNINFLFFKFYAQNINKGEEYFNKWRIEDKLNYNEKIAMIGESYTFIFNAKASHISGMLADYKEYVTKGLL